MSTDLVTPTAMLARVREVHATVRSAEVELLMLAAAWADAHPDPDQVDDEIDPLIPAWAWSAGAPFAAAIGVSTAAGEALVRDALTLRHRLPGVWRRVLAGAVPVWRARRIAQTVVSHPADVAEWLDERVAPVADRVGIVTLDRLLDEAMLRLYPEERELAQLEALDRRHATLHEASLTHTGVAEMTLRGDWADLSDFDEVLSLVAAALDEVDDAEQTVSDSLDVRRSRAVGVLADPARALALLERRSLPAPRRRIRLVVHLSEEALGGCDPVGRCEAGARPVLEQQIRAWCGRSDALLTVVPVIDLADHVSVDRYEVGERLRERTGLLHTRCAFPWCTRPAPLCDCDHVVAHSTGGATCDCNLAPLCRRHHRLKTSAGWSYTTVETGVWLWSDPHGQQFVRDGNGTRDVTSSDRPVTLRSGCRRGPPP